MCALSTRPFGERCQCQRSYILHSREWAKNVACFFIRGPAKDPEKGACRKTLNPQQSSKGHLLKKKQESVVILCYYWGGYEISTVKSARYIRFKLEMNLYIDSHPCGCGHTETEVSASSCFVFFQPVPLNGNHFTDFCHHKYFFKG